MIETKNGMRGSHFWLNSTSLTFEDIVLESRVPQKWARYSLIEDIYKDNILKPVNRYVSNLYPRPELVTIEGNTIRLRQKTHAEIWVDRKHADLYALDKCWQRQFYPSSKTLEDSESFAPTYKFYMPWVLDLDSTIKVESAGDCFFVGHTQLQTKKNNPLSDFIDVPFIDFKIKKNGKHMKNDTYGIIEIGTPMYDMVFTLSEEDLGKINEQYR